MTSQLVKLARLANLKILLLDADALKRSADLTFFDFAP